MLSFAIWTIKFFSSFTGPCVYIYIFIIKKDIIYAHMCVLMQPVSVRKNAVTMTNTRKVLKMIKRTHCICVKAPLPFSAAASSANQQQHRRVRTM